MPFDLQDMRGNWNYPSAIRFGAGRITELPDACRELGMERPLIVTDRGIAKLPFVDEILALQEDAGLASGLFYEVDGNPDGEQVMAGVQVLRERDHDGVVALGGGSALDVGKAVALMAGQNRPLWDFEDGSEVGRCSVIVHAESQRKVLIFHPDLMPAKVICDPVLSAGLPAGLTAAVGMDALSHNLEAFCAPGFHPMADGIALEGMRLVHEHLIDATENGLNLVARSGMMLASMMGATAFQKGLGAMHAMSHPIGGVIGAHHGLTNAVVMPYVLHFNQGAIAEKMAVLATHLGLPQKNFGGVMDWVLGLRERLKIPHTLRELDVEERHAAQLAPMAVVDPTAGGNPIQATTEQYETLFLQAVRGQI